MTNFYLSAFPEDPIIRGAVMQSSDSEFQFLFAHAHSETNLASETNCGIIASQPQWQLGNQLEAISVNQSCPTGAGQLDCLREKDGLALQAILLSSGNQFQPVIDNITVFKDYVKQTREGKTARVPLLIGTNKVCMNSSSY